MLTYRHDGNSPQQPVLLQKVERLQALRPRGLRTAELVNAYARVLQSYASGRPPRIKPSHRAGRTKRFRSVASPATIDELDARRICCAANSKDAPAG